MQTMTRRVVEQKELHHNVRELSNRVSLVIVQQVLVQEFKERCSKIQIVTRRVVE